MKTLSSRFARRFVLVLGFLPALAVVAPSVRAADSDDPVMQAMRDELARSTAQLQLENLEKPYFIAYRVQERRNQGVSAEFGSTLNRYESRSRSLTVEIRVGSPALDNTNFQAGYSSVSALLGGASASLSLDDNYTVLRRQIWLATDRAYKQAVELLSKKKAVLENKTRTDNTPDFSPQEPATVTDRRPGKPIDLDQAEALVRELSAVFRTMPAVAISNVGLGATDELTRYVNSEGSSFRRQAFEVNLVGGAATQAADGFSLDDHHLVFRRSWETLPPKAELLAALRDLGNRVTAQRDAALPDQYNGPVLFEGQAAAEVFAQAFAPQLAARRPPVTETNMPAGLAGAAENPFLDKLGARVLPDFLSVTDDATLTQLNGVPLYGDSRVDDEGVPTRAVSLVEKGRLKTLLVSRSPVRGVPKSTGSRQGNGPLPSNLIVTASDGLDAPALKAELLKLVQQRGKDYGVVVRRLGDPLLRVATGTPIITSSSRGGVRLEPALLASKVFLDGHEEPLRNVEIAGLDTPAFKDILAAGREPYVHTGPFRTGMTGGAYVCSFAVPSLLFEEVTLKKPSGEIPQPPVAKHPFFAE